MDWTPDPKILKAIENAVAASRWRTAARFEGRETAARFRCQADARHAAATACLESFTSADGPKPIRTRIPPDTAGGQL